MSLSSDGADRRAERAYGRLIDHAGGCSVCRPEGDGGDRDKMCSKGQVLLDQWERAEELAVKAERAAVKEG